MDWACQKRKTPCEYYIHRITVREYRRRYRAFYYHVAWLALMASLRSNISVKHADTMGDWAAGVPLLSTKSMQSIASAYLKR